MYVSESAFSASVKQCFQPGRLAFTTAFFVLLTSPVVLLAGDSPGSVPDAIVRGIEANYARLTSVQASIEITALDFSVTERTVTTGETEGGGTFSMVREPKTVSLFRLLLQGSDFYRGRCKDGEEQDYFYLRNGVWTQFSAEHKMAWLRLPEQMPGMVPIDPRDFGAIDSREPFLDRLRVCKVVEAKKETRAGGVTFARLVMEQENGHRWLAEFDGSKSFLPVKIEEFAPNGTINIEERHEYSQVLKQPAATWFPEKIVRRCFGRPGDKTDEDGVANMLTEVVKDIQVNQHLPDDDFVKVLPPGTRVSDAVSTSVYTSGLNAEDKDTRVKQAELAPDVDLRALDGQVFRTRARNKPLLVIFFATWCGPCVVELPRVEKEIWEHFEADDLEIVVVGREHTDEELAVFKKERRFSLPMAADPARETYAKFAVKGVPRAYLIGRDGKIAYQSAGYTPPKFDALIRAIEDEVGASELVNK